METKICNKCGMELPKTNIFFNIRKENKDGFVSHCKKCESEYRKRIKEKNKDTFVNCHKQYIKEHKTKICNKCEKELPATDKYFPRRKDTKDGFRNICRECENKRLALYYEHNKENISESHKMYYRKNKIAVNRQSRMWYEKNKDEVLMKIRIRYQKNREKIIKQQKLYVKKHPEKYRLIHQKYLAIKHKLPHNLTTEQWQQIKQHFNNKCAYCGKELPLTQEHFIPLSKGGEYTCNNIIPACQSCNSSKHNKSFFEWYPKYRHYSKKREKAILEFLGYKDNKQQLSIII